MRTQLEKTLIALLATAALGSCKSSSFKGSGSEKKQNSPGLDARTASTEVFTGADQMSFQSDIIFLLDTSGSMSRKIAQTLATIGALISDFLQKSQGLDYHIIIVGSAVDDDLKLPASEQARIGRVTEGVGSYNALSRALEVLAGTHTATGAQLRPYAVKELVVVSDDNSDITDAEFLAGLDKLPAGAPPVFVNAIVASERRCGGFLNLGGAVGKVYLQLAGNARTKGVVGDICQYENQQAWSGIFANLGKQITQSKGAQAIVITLKGRPANPTGAMTVRMNGQDLERSFWEYNSGTNQVLIKKPTLPTDRIEVTY